MSNNSRLRHILKTVTWRFLASIDTFVISWLYTGNIQMGLSISFFEVFSKIFLYYLHERVWFRFNFPNSKLRHLYKTLTWRTIGTTDTILISYIITSSFTSSINIGITETITKMIIYYIHEKIWYKSKFGLKD